MIQFAKLFLLLRFLSSCNFLKFFQLEFFPLLNNEDEYLQNFYQRESHHVSHGEAIKNYCKTFRNLLLRKIRLDERISFVFPAFENIPDISKLRSLKT